MLDISGLKLPFIGGMLVTGNVYFVDSGGEIAHDERRGLHPKRSVLATLEAAYDLCTTNNGDFIVILPGHTETLALSLTWAKNGITVVGIGNFALRPTFTGTAAVDDIDVTGNNNRFSNLLFKHITANSTAMINLAGTGNQIDNCRFDQGVNAVFAVVITDTADDSVVEDCEFYCAADGPDSAISIEVVATTTAGAARIRISRNDFTSVDAAKSWDLGVIFTDAVFTNGRIDYNTFQYVKASLGGIELTAAATGLVNKNYVSGTTYAELIEPGSMSCHENFVHDEAADSSAILDPPDIVT